MIGALSRVGRNTTGYNEILDEWGDIFPAASHRRNVFVDTPRCLAAIPILANILIHGYRKDRGLFKPRDTRMVSKNIQARSSC